MDLFNLSDLPPKVLANLFYMVSCLALTAMFGWLNEYICRKKFNEILHELLRDDRETTAPTH